MGSYYASDRIKGIVQTLMEPKNKVIKRIRRSGLIEKVPLIILKCEEWSDFEKYRYQPRSVASVVACAENKKNISLRFQEEKTDARVSEKNAKKKIERQFNKIEAITKCNFSELPSKLRMRSFFKNNKNLKEYGLARARKASASEKNRRWSSNNTKPAEKALRFFCSDMKKLLSIQNKKPDYKLIADIANLFSLSKKRQTENSVRKRFSRDKI